jgi:hypothetical protein
LSVASPIAAEKTQPNYQKPAWAFRIWKGKKKIDVGQNGT